MADVADDIASQLMGQAPELPANPTDTPAPPPEQSQPGDPPAPTDTQTPPEKPEPGYVPIQALLDEREKRQRNEREVEELRQWRQQQEARRQAPQRPDMYDDPEGYAAYLEQQQHAALWNATESVSKRFASKEHGAEAIGAAEQWALERVKTDPTIAQRFRASADPYEFLVGEFKRDQLLKEIGSDPDAYVRRKAVELGLGSAQQPGAATPSQPQPGASTPPPRSLATVPGSGGTQHAPPGGALEGLKFNLG